MKVSIVTVHSAYNYGGVLQAFSLYEYIKGFGNIDVFMQDFPVHKGNKEKTLKEHVYIILRSLFRFMYKKDIELSEKRFNDFVSNFRLTNDHNLPLYILGSDQVWNPFNLDGVFSMEFVNPKSKKASYAASIGVNIIPSEKENLFINMINRLDYLSARELTGVEEVKRLTGRKCRLDVDPVFLNTIDFWRSYEHKVDINKPYILVYLLHIPKNVNEIISSLKKKYKCDVRVIDQTGMLNLRLKGTIGMANIGPREFLWLVDNAEFVVTSSFHGTAFSIVFEKQFLPLINPAMPNRINNLLSMANIEIGSTLIDYQNVKRHLIPYIDDSKNYLKELVNTYEK